MFSDSADYILDEASNSAIELHGSRADRGRGYRYFKTGMRAHPQDAAAVPGGFVIAAGCEAVADMKSL